MAELTKLEQRAADRVQKWLDQFDEHDLKISYEIGKVVADLVAKAKKDKEHYGRDVVQNIASSLDRKKSTLERCSRIAKAFPDRRTFSSFVAMQNGTYRLRVSHMALLSRIPNMEERKECAAQAVADKWTKSKLQSYLDEHYPIADSKRRPNAGRPPQAMVPANSRECVRHMTRQLEQLHRRMENDWFGEKFNLVDELRAIPDDQVDDEFVAQLTEVIEYLRELAGSAYVRAGELEKVYVTVSKKVQFVEA